MLKLIRNYTIITGFFLLIAFPIGAESFAVSHTEKEWRSILTPSQYHILREKGTEAPHSGEYNHHKETGTYHCAACDQALFSSNHKYDSKTGWPSFWQAINDKTVLEKPDNSLFMNRTELICSRCGSHLGHLFADGPPPTGLRYCINSEALRFKP